MGEAGKEEQGVRGWERGRGSRGKGEFWDLGADGLRWGCSTITKAC